MWSSLARSSTCWSKWAGPLSASVALVALNDQRQKPPITKCEEESPSPRFWKRRSTVNKASFPDANIQRTDTRKELSKLRRIKTALFRQWERDEDGWRELPARAWPAYQPNEEQLRDIEQQVEKLGCSGHSEDEVCRKLIFDMSTSLVFYTVDPPKGLEQYRQLAENGHIDAMVACGIILVEGLGGIPPREEEGMEWLEMASALGSKQACYELGVVYYTGIDGVVEENPKQAYEHFVQAANADHVAAMYMMADCLIEGEGTEKNVAKAVSLLYRAADKGHRYARQRIRELLAKQEYED